jgi:hypothetical protein
LGCLILHIKYILAKSAASNRIIELNVMSWGINGGSPNSLSSNALKLPIVNARPYDLDTRTRSNQNCHNKYKIVSITTCLLSKLAPMKCAAAIYAKRTVIYC